MLIIPFNEVKSCAKELLYTEDEKFLFSNVLEDSPQKVAKSKDGTLHFKLKSISKFQHMVLMNTNALEIEVKVFKNNVLVASQNEVTKDVVNIEQYYFGDFSLKEKVLFSFEKLYVDVDVEVSLKSVNTVQCFLGLCYAGYGKNMGANAWEIEFNAKDLSVVKETSNGSRVRIPREVLEDITYTIISTKQKYTDLMSVLMQAKTPMLFLTGIHETYATESYVCYGFATLPKAVQKDPNKLEFQLEVKEVK